MSLREKALEIANSLPAEGLEDGVAIAAALKRTRQFFQVDSTGKGDALHEIEDDFEMLEPGDFGPEEGVINTGKESELAYWAEQFQISTDELKTAALMQGNTLSEIRKYLKI
ncbi:DUF3606 domain-containing protein [Pedobacter jeongneungensis]|uniref:DUF3606 domain-containing protein n=1 Tax=Pedobacter jeongneungensis TaxID=947309 RepID=UPI00046A09D7|nr:DUF3606 domain-containing protein [Pedobacter jeongneungensis]